MTPTQPLSWPTGPVAHDPVILREFSAADLPMVREMSADPYVPLIGTLPPNASTPEALAKNRKSHTGRFHRSLLQ